MELVNLAMSKNLDSGRNGIQRREGMAKYGISIVVRLFFMNLHIIIVPIAE